MIPPSCAPCFLGRPQPLTCRSGLPVETVSLRFTSGFFHTYHRQKSGLGNSYSLEAPGRRSSPTCTELESRAPKQHRDKRGGDNRLIGPYVTVF
jgi:hypothetical protein